MRVAAEVERLPGVRRAALLVATPANRELLEHAGLLDGPARAARPTDLVLAVAAESQEAADAALAHARDLLAAAAPASGDGLVERRPPTTLAAALAELPRANLALVSTPGPYATAEALKALKRGLHVFLFSDNVPAADELLLKRLAGQKGLLLMGPDCGTAILDGVPLGFANAVRRGRVGFVAASGTGLQAVTCLVDRLGEGVSQAIGVGGHDLSEDVGGLMMLAGIERLLADPGTTVLVLVSKPPAPAVAQRVLGRVGGGKPVVVCFLGGDPGPIRAAGAVPAATLEEAARVAVRLARGGAGAAATAATAIVDSDLRAAVETAARRLTRGQRAVRGLYSGGTLCAEAALVLTAELGRPPADLGHTLVDLGDDEFTVGRPHPMIDFRLRNERIVAAAGDGETAVLLLDIVLGYGSHPDPAGALGPALAEARARAAEAGRGLVLLGSVCGTAADPQGLDRQEAALRAAGVVLAPSNAEAARLAAVAVREAGRG
jgi:succinyl-CoA synthetase alpha subunit